MIIHPLRLLRKPNPQIRPAAKGGPRPGQHNTFHPLIDIQHRIQKLKVVHHLDGVGIALFGAVERHDDDGRGDGGAGGVVGYEDVLQGKGGVGFRGDDVGADIVAGHVDSVDRVDDDAVGMGKGCELV
jgi:hypothetical protein